MTKTVWADVYVLIMLGALILATCLLSKERGIEAGSLVQKIAMLEAKIEGMRPVPRISIQKGTVYAGSGELVIEEIGK